METDDLQCNPKYLCANSFEESDAAFKYYQETASGYINNPTK